MPSETDTDMLMLLLQLISNEQSSTVVNIYYKKFFNFL